MPHSTVTRRASSLSKSTSSVLRPLTDPELAPPVSRIFDLPLRPVPFNSERGRPQEADGEALSKFGWRFRELFADAHKVDRSEVDLGLIRRVEALNADTDRNLAALTSPQVKRTENGVLHYVRLLANTPLIMAWLLNGRALRRMPIELGNHAHLVTSAVDHRTLALPTLQVDGVESVMETVAAQRKLLGLANYTNADKKRDRVDSIIRFGVLEPPDVVLTQLIAGKDTAWMALVAEGAQRLFSALLALDVLTNRSVSGLATQHWFDGETRLRDLTVENLRDLEEALKFTSSPAAAYLPGSDTHTWLKTTAATTPAAVAFQLLRTMEINLILAVQPDPVTTHSDRNPVSGTIQELIRSYHVPGKAKDPWERADVEGMIAIGVIDELREQGRVSDAERSAWLGETAIPWQGPAVDETGSPGNRVYMVAKLLATITAQNAVMPGEGDDEAGDSLSLVNQHLRVNGMRVHSDDRAKVGAAQALVALRMHASGYEGQITAALFGTFRSAEFWKTSDHSPGDQWPAMLTLPLPELADAARRERRENRRNLDERGPAQRALAALGAVALTSNPELVKNENALTRTGRGGGGRTGSIVRASDPSVLLMKMVQDEAGLNQLEDAVAALIAPAVPAEPIDRRTEDTLSDFYLRKHWLDERRSDTDNPHTEFGRLIQDLVQQIQSSCGMSDQLRSTLPSNVFNLNASDELELEFEEEPLFMAIGVNERAANTAIPLLMKLVDFFQVGKAYGAAASRAVR